MSTTRFSFDRFALDGLTQVSASKTEVQTQLSEFLENIKQPISAGTFQTDNYLAVFDYDNWECQIRAILPNSPEFECSRVRTLTMTCLYSIRLLSAMNHRVTPVAWYRESEVKLILRRLRILIIHMRRLMREARVNGKAFIENRVRELKRLERAVSPNRKSPDITAAAIFADSILQRVHQKAIFLAA